MDSAVRIGIWAADNFRAQLNGARNELGYGTGGFVIGAVVIAPALLGIGHPRVPPEAHTARRKPISRLSTLSPAGISASLDLSTI